MKFLFSAFLFFLTVSVFKGQSQQPDQEAYNYMATIGSGYEKISEDYMQYASAVAHNSARKAEKRRADLIKSIYAVKETVAKAPCFKDNCALRDSAVSYLTLNFYVLNYDYEKIVNMEEVSEQSYDLMEAYMLARDLAEKKVEESGKRLEEVEKAFAAKYNIPLSPDKSELSRKIEQANQVNDHYKDVYLIFFKSYKQEAYLLDALDKKDFSAAEQNKNALLQTATEGLTKLTSLKAFRNDRSLITACRQALDFYKNEATKMSAIIDFMMKAENFNKMKETFDAKDPMMRTKEEVDQYNKAANELNTLQRTFTTNYNYLNTNRSNVVNNWNNQSENYQEKYIPKYN